MRARIHRGAAEVGGSCVELEAEGRRLVLDAGLPLRPERVQMRELLPDVPGLWHAGDGSLEGLIISHGHPDHYGLADLVDPAVPIFTGQATERILREAAFFSPSTRTFPVAGHLHDGRPIELGPFTVTPVLVDHSAYDAYALIVEAGGRRLAYSGDLRAHGRKRSTGARLASAARGADLLLLEGTRIADDGRPPTTEEDVERQLMQLATETPGMLLVAASAQNIDRLVSLYRAALRSGRQLVVDLYGDAMLTATGRTTIPTARSSSHLRVFLPAAQRRKVIAAGAFDRTVAVRTSRVYPEQLAEHPERFVMLFRPSMMRELERARCLEGARLVWSMWRGYLDGDDALARFVERLGSPLAFSHASGHASAADLRRVIEDLRPDRVVPIHTDDPAACRRLSDRVELRDDGVWWPV
jgi:ribonuclease J